jgi:sulfonate transport system ATP-binding protein
MMIALQERPSVTAPILPSNAVIELEEVEKHFERRTAIYPLNLQIFSGELLAIVGRSGCGKSTLLRILAGLEAASSGVVKIEGRSEKGTHHSTRLMFQEAALLPWKTVLANVRLAASRQPRGAELALGALRRVGLESRANDWPSILSGGQRQRVALARALASEASILLLDEPLGALDALTRLEMQKLIEEVWLRDRFTGVLVTHEVEEAVALADRVLVMEDGKFIAEKFVDLPRPRHRGSPEFIALKEYLLGCILHRAV